MYSTNCTRLMETDVSGSLAWFSFQVITVGEDESHVHHSMEQTIFSSASYTSWMMLCTITVPFHMYPCPAIRDTLFTSSFTFAVLQK